MHSVVDQSSLPRPDERPGADVVIFDGRCRLCQAQVRRLARWDLLKRLAFISLHDPEVSLRWPDLPHDELMQNMYLVDSRGRRYKGAAALRVLSRRLPILWPVAPLLHLPGTLGIWQWLYQQVARRRYRLGGAACDEQTCHVHMGR
ncbi:MAG: DUF393 domain-containing protein [Pirellulales bacterium]|nr:DUF393 domain-containing protein [Pirellulales bacterium]